MSLKIKINVFVQSFFIYVSIINISYSDLKVTFYLCLVVKWWRDYCTVSDVIEQSGVTERYLANAIISDKSK